MNRGIPTTYRSTRCRSRLEARWLCVLDLCGIPWAYEPFDLRGYVPDLLIADRLLCEIRPLSWLMYDDGPLVEAREQIAWAASETHHTPVLLGVDPDVIEWCVGAEWEQLRLAWRFDVRRGDLFAQLGDVWGDKPVRFAASHDMAALWRIAGSRVQWKPQKGARVIRRPEDRTS